MLRIVVSSLLLMGALASCMPATNKVAGVTVTPMLLKVSEAAAAGQNVTVQGRYLGGPSTGRIRLGADERGQGGYFVPAGDIVSWTDSEVVFKVPAAAPVGGSWLYIEVGDMKSTGLPFSIKAQ